jgi:homoserine dehydrogenase
MRTINIGIAGLGTVGSGVVSVLQKNKSFGVPLNIAKIAEIDHEKRNSIKIDSPCLISDARKLIDDSGVDIVVELIGGCSVAKDIVIGALKNGKTVVTANKALLAEYGEEIFETAEKSTADIYYEASVAGGIPIIKILREGLIANKISSVFGIVNGTSNYILTKMQEDNADFKGALTEAQKEGYAERDPTLDIEGIDSAHKLTILASLATGQWIDLKDIYIQGISHITHSDISYAEELGYSIKLLAICKNEKGKIEVRVHPTLLPKQHQLSWVRGVYNAIFVIADNVGNQLFYGRGAGSLPTASAVVADIVDAARNLSMGIKHRIPLVKQEKSSAKLVHMDNVMSQCYLRFTTLDRPGVLAKIAGILGKNGISIASVLQKGRHKVNAVPIVVMTHKAYEKDINKALTDIDKLEEVKAKTVMIRVEE